MYFVCFEPLVMRIERESVCGDIDDNDDDDA